MSDDAIDLSQIYFTSAVAGLRLILIRGTTLNAPPAQAHGGCLNSGVTVALPGGSLAPWASINVGFLLGVQQSGAFRFLLNVEALTGTTEATATEARPTKSPDHTKQR